MGMQVPGIVGNKIHDEENRNSRERRDGTFPAPTSPQGQYDPGNQDLGNRSAAGSAKGRAGSGLEPAAPRLQSWSTGHVVGILPPLP
eukprot:16436554-Heterocapsa_arctica.AAC.1